jgi:hypothetical protein
MKTFRKILGGLFILGGFIALINLLHAQDSAAPDSIVQVTAESQGLSLVSPGDLPENGTFWLVDSNGVLSPDPCLPPEAANLPIYGLADGVFLVDGTCGQVATDPGQVAALGMSAAVSEALAAQATNIVNIINQVQDAEAGSVSRALGARFGRGMAMDDDEEDGGFTPMFTFDTNSLWLEITNYDGTFAYLNLHNATDQVYAIWSTTDLTVPYTNWTVETELWPVGDQTNVMPFTVPTLGRTNLFMRAEDWTGVDSDGDGVPDWWAWQYWGTNNLPDTNLDYSGNDNTFAEDYSNNILPTVFTFTGIEVMNNYVNTMSVPAQLDVAGNPYYLAISVDDTNYASDAVWGNYSSSNITVNLGLTEGWHDVWIGLRGHADDPTNAVWLHKRLNLDLTPPQLVITSPTNGTLDMPLMQLQGYSPEPLPAISYDLTNAAGLVTNQQILVIDQYFDTNTSAFTTNTFQGFDIPLTNGLNVFTLHATDLAGNVTTTNFSFTVDYSGKTNPPVIQLNWPQDGMKVCGSNILWTGSISDPTATVTAQMVDTDGNTNIFNGVAGRDGTFWVENLPLGSGTNALTLTVADAAGNLATTNINVIQGDAGLVINPVSAAATTVTGTINSTNYTVWVNGVKATVNDSGAWTADNVPIAPQRLVQAAAIPNADNGGNGSGGGAGLNPSSANSQNGTALAADASNIYYDYYQSDFEMDIPSDSAEGHWFEQWQYASGGFEVDETWNWEYGYPYIYKKFVWPGNAWPQFDPYPTSEVTFYGSWQTNSLSTYYVPLSEEYADHTEATQNGIIRKLDEHVKMKFKTGGPPGSTRKNLYVLSGTLNGGASPPQAMSLGSLGHLGSDGNLYVVLPDNTTEEVTPNVAGMDSYGFHLNPPAKYHPYINLYTSTTNANLDTNTPEVCVGQLVTLALDWQGGVPPYANILQHWVLPGEYVNQPTNYSATCATYVRNDNLLTNLVQQCWYVNQPGGTVTIGMDLQFANGQTVPVAAAGNITVYRPSVQFTPITTGTPTISPSGQMFPQTIIENGGILFQATVTSTDFSGNANWVQLINRIVIGDWPGYVNLNTFGDCLDNDPFYNTQGGLPGTPAVNTPITSGSTTVVTFGTDTGNGTGSGDEPGVGCYPFVVSITDSFKTYLVFKPTGDSIWVTLGRVDWGWSGYAVVDADGTGDLIDSSTNAPTYTNTDEFPVWSSIYQNSK